MAKPVILTILDGWGLRDDSTANAPKLAQTPTMDQLWATCPHAQLVTHGPDAGLPSGQMGNSEVGHTNIGAGRVVAMDLGQIDLAIEDGSFAANAAIVAFADAVAAAGGAAHVMGVVSDGGVHGHITHLKAAASVLAGRGLPVRIHAVTDGRDVAPDSAGGFLVDLEAWIAAQPGNIAIATVTGRYYAMDRDNRWERVEAAYRTIVEGQAPDNATAQAASDAAARDYARDVMDEFFTPTVIADHAGIAPSDGFFCLNFRADRAREILRAIADPAFDGFAREKPALAALLGMVEYSDDHSAWMPAAFPKRVIVNTLGAWVAQHGLRQFRLAETEKYPHVTFFLNGGKEVPEPGEERFMPASPKVATYDLAPEMSAAEVTDRFLEAIAAGYDLIVTNYANPDMVGHTGDLSAAITACETVDSGLGRIVDAVVAAGGAMIVTADHGNCETMVDPDTGGPHTAHTLNPVPVVLVGGPEGAVLRNGRLADLAPTLLHLMGLPQPPEMTGRSLLT